MNKSLLIYLLFLLSFSVMAESDLSYQSNCGVFKILGTVKEGSERKLMVVINEGTKSEITLNTPKQNALKFFAYKNRALVGEFEIIKKFNGTHGEISKIINIDYATDSPLNAGENTGIKLIKKMKCKKNRD